MANNLIISSARRFLELYGSETEGCIDSTQIDSLLEKIIQSSPNGLTLLKDFAREVYQQYGEKYSGVRRLSLLWLGSGRRDHPYSLVPEMIKRMSCDGESLNWVAALEVYEDFGK